MSDAPVQRSEVPESEHAWVHEHLAAYLAGGLEAGERARLDGHINGCQECFDAFTEARDVDRALQRTLGALAPDSTFEERVITQVREQTMKRQSLSMVRRAAYATAAAVALAATGVFANYVMHQEGRFNNPLSEHLMAQADADAPDLNGPVERVTAMWRDPGERSGAVSANYARSAKEQELEVLRPKVAKLADQNNDLSRTAGHEKDAEDGIRKLQLQVGGLSRSDSKLSVLSTSGADKNVGGRDEIVLGRHTSALEEDRKQAVEGIVTDAKKLYDSANYKEAADLYAQATVIDPQNIEARQRLLVTQGRMADERYESIMDETGKGLVQQNVDRAGVLGGYAAATEPRGRFSVGAGATSNAQNGGAASEVGRPTVQVTGGGGAGATAMADVDALGTVRGITVTNGQAAQGIGNGYLGYKDLVAQAGNGSADAWTFNGRQNIVAGNSTMTGPDALKVNNAPGLSSTGGLTKVGAGTISMSGADTYSGDTEVNGGTVRANVGGKVEIADASGLASKLGTFNEAVPGATGVPAAGGGGNGGTAALGKAGEDGSDHAYFGTLVTDPGKEREGPGQANKPREEPKEAAGANAEMPRINLSSLAQKTQTQNFGSGGFGGGVPSAAKSDVKSMETKGVSDFGDGRVGSMPRLGDTPWQDTVHSKEQVAMAEPSMPQQRPGTATAPAPAGGSGGAAPQGAPEVMALKIIRNGVVEFEVRSFDDTYMTVGRIVQDEKGYVSSTSSDKLANGKVRGVIVVRVPPERLDRFLLSIRALGELKAQQISAPDVTKQYYDIASELRGLVTMETRLLDLIKNGKGEVKDLIEAEKQLGETRVRIEKLKGEISYYDNLVGMATITITAYEKDISTPTAASEQEVVNVNVETEEVEAKYQAARKIFDEAKSHIVESQLKNSDAEHVAAHIVADVPPEQADFVAGQLKQLGKVASFNRDRRQTTTGGTGVPAANVQLEHKDTRITVDLFNLANMQPRETTVLRVAVRDVAGTYGKVRDLLRQDAPAAAGAPAADQGVSRTVGRVISSNLNGQQVEQMTAELRAEVRGDQADAVLAAIREGGEVLASSLAVNPDNASTTMAKRGIQLSLVNIAAVPGKETDTLSIAVRDVEGSYKNLLQAIGRNVAAAPGGGGAVNPLASPTVGRVIASSLNGQQPEQKIGDVRAEVREDQAEAVLSALRGGGEVISSAVGAAPEGAVATGIKRTLVVRLVSTAAVPPREAQSLTTVAEDVPAAFGKLMGALQAPQLDGAVRVLSSQLNQSDARSVTATLSFEARREALAAVDKAFADSGIDVLSRNVARSTDTAGTLDSKVLFQIRELRSAESLDPRRTMVVSREVENVPQAMEKLRGLVKGQNVKEVDYNVERDPSGRTTGRIVLDMAVGATPAVWGDIESLGGAEKSNQETRNAQVPDSRFAKNRIELTLTNPAGIVQGDKGLGQSVRAALSSAAGALLYSVYLVLTGVLFVLPFALIVWPVWKLARRRKAAA